VVIVTVSMTENLPMCRRKPRPQDLPHDVSEVKEIEALHAALSLTSPSSTSSSQRRDDRTSIFTGGESPRELTLDIEII